MDVVKDYCNLFEQYCWMHELYGKCTLHLIIGQLPNVLNKKLYYRSSTHYNDLRFHLCYMSPTGTGKGAGANFVYNVCQKVGLNMQSIMTITDAGLIGQPTKRLEYNATTKSMEMVVTIEKGLLDPAKGVNILFFPEASPLFKQNPGQYVQERMDYFQVVMNPMGTNDNKLSKRLAVDMMVEFNPTCSLFFTTYEPHGLFDILINRGLLQRMFFVVNTITEEQRMEMVKRSVMNMGTDPSERLKTDTQLDVIAKEIAEINNHAGQIDEIKQDPKVHDAMKGIISIMFDSVADCRQSIKEQLYKFIQRYTELIWKISAHHALMRLDDTIRVEDVVYAKEFAMVTWRRLISLFELRYVSTDRGYFKTLHDIQLIIKELENLKLDSYTEADLSRAIRNALGVSGVGAVAFINELRNKGFIMYDREEKRYKRTGKQPTGW